MASGNGAKQKHRIVVPPDGLEQITVDEIIGMQDGDIRLVKVVLGRFVLNGDVYLSHEEGMRIVGKMSVAQLRSAADELVNAVEDTVPKE